MILDLLKHALIANQASSLIASSHGSHAVGKICGFCDAKSRNHVIAQRCEFNCQLQPVSRVN
jgi:hypothetical protein